MKILDGVHPFRINYDEPTIPPGSTDPPEWLDGLALEHWRELAPILDAARIMTAGDRSALAALCEDYASWRLNPASKAKDRYVRLLCEFGLTPSSRTRLKAMPEKPKDDLAEFLEAKKA